MEENNQGNYQQSEPNNTQPPVQNQGGGNQDIPSTGLNVLSFFFPIVGLILFLVWKDQYPVKAKKIGKWAIIGFCVGVALSIIWGIIVFCTALFVMA